MVLGCWDNQALIPSFSCDDILTGNIIFQPPEDCVLLAVTKAVKECLKREKMKFKYEVLKTALLNRVHPEHEPETHNWKDITIASFDNRCIRITTDKVQLGVQLFVEEVPSVYTLDTLNVTEENEKQNEYVIIDGNRKNNNCLYVVKQFDKPNGTCSQPFFLCYDVNGIGERKQRWPEIPIQSDSQLPPKVYSIDCELMNRPKPNKSSVSV